MLGGLGDGRGQRAGLRCARSTARGAGGALRVTDFGAVADDDLADDAAIDRALKALKPGGWLVFPPGRYQQARSVLVSVPGVTLWGPGATLQATDPRDHTLGLRADGVRLYGLTLTAAPDQRRSEPAQARISLYREGPTPQRGNVVRGVTVDARARWACWSTVRPTSPSPATPCATRWPMASTPPAAAATAACSATRCTTWATT